VPAARRAAATLFESLVDAGAQSGKCWSQPTGQTGHYGEKQGEDGHANIECDLVDAGQSLGQPADAEPHKVGGEKKAEQASGQAQQEAFEDGLTQEAGGGRAQSAAHGDFALAADGAYQQQSGQIGAGNQHHDKDGEKQGAHQRTGALHGFFAKRTNGCGPGKTLYRGRMGAHGFLRHVLGVVLRLRDSNARLEAADHVETPAGALVDRDFVWREAQRNPELAVIEPAGEQGEFEIARHNADDEVGLAVEEKPGSEHVRIAVKAVLPE